jgi:long-subunit fatty acid transport protein
MKRGDSKMISRINIKFLPALLVILFSITILSAQNNGELLGYQGIADVNKVGVKAIAMGTNYTAISGSINSLYYNTAGLADIDKFQISFGTMTGSREMWENKIWGPQSKIPLLTPMFEGLMDIPRGLDFVTDTELWEQLDDLNPINVPTQGEYHYNRDAAKWIKEDNFTVPVNNISFAMPFEMLGSKYVLAGTYNNKHNFTDYDRNDSYTSPDINDRVPIYIESITGDTTIVNWFQYERIRTGNISSAKVALSGNFGDNLKIGIGVESIFGKTDDEMTLDQTGEFTLLNQDFLYSNDSLHTAVTSGTSNFSGFSTDIGFLLDLETIDIGFSMKLPTTIERDWNYNTKTRYYVDQYDSLAGEVLESDIETITTKSSGVDKLKIPMTFNFGVAIQAIDQMKITIDMVYKGYKDADFDFADNIQDSIHTGWANQLSYGMGVAYDFNEKFSLLGGYRSTPLAFIPWGAADKEEGPRADTFSCGFSWKVLHGAIDMAYEYRKLKYLEPAFNYLNFQVENRHNIHFGYTFIF